MRVTLAGFNLDKEIIDQVSEIINHFPYNNDDYPFLGELLYKLSKETLTPETLSAAYARISRSDKGIGELRRDSRVSVARTRRTNERIVFGLGHASIAEHAVVNLDITDISRLALEELESHRLASYTEASQRYIAMTGDFISPQEIKEAGLSGRFEKDCLELFTGYRKLVEILEEFYGDMAERDRHTKAREDARYVLPLACRSQVGVTVNARVVEWMIRQFNCSKLSEMRQLGKMMHDAVKNIISSLVRYTQPNRSLEAAQAEIDYFTQTNVTTSESGEEADVELIDAPQKGERNTLAAILFSSGSESFAACLDAVRMMKPEEKNRLLITAHKCISAHEPVRRELELGSFTFSVTLSSSAFAQLKRHRIATLIKQNYEPSLGVTIPPTILKAGSEEIFRNCIDISDNLYNSLKGKLEDEFSTASHYALTNAHRRRVIFSANVRELTHFARLREDIHAQWDIRNIGKEMIGLARKACPALMLFASGKDVFDKLSDELFGG